MALTVNNINTGGAVVTIGGSVTAVDPDGFYIGTSGGVDVGCTTGGVKISYTYDTQDIYCDQSLAPVETAVVKEEATIEFEMLESASANLRYAIGLYTSDDSVSGNKTGVGGLTTINYLPLKLVIADNDNASLSTTWTFFKTMSKSLETSFERENPTTIKAKFTAYADTTHASGHQLFSVYETLT